MYRKFLSIFFTIIPSIYYDSELIKYHITDDNKLIVIYEMNFDCVNGLLNTELLCFGSPKLFPDENSDMSNWTFDLVYQQYAIDGDMELKLLYEGQ
jgi:hypothetical protein